MSSSACQCKARPRPSQWPPPGEKQERFAAFLGEVLVVPPPSPPKPIIHNTSSQHPMTFQRPRILHNFARIKGRWNLVETSTLEQIPRHLAAFVIYIFFCRENKCLSIRGGVSVTCVCFLDWIGFKKKSRNISRFFYFYFFSLLNDGKTTTSYGLHRKPTSTVLFVLICKRKV